MCWHFNVRLIAGGWICGPSKARLQAPPPLLFSRFLLAICFLFGLFSPLRSLVPGYQLTKSDHKKTWNYSIISYNNIIANETEKDIKKWRMESISYRVDTLSTELWVPHMVKRLLGHLTLHFASTVETYQSQALYYTHHASTLVGSLHAIIIYW